MIELLDVEHRSPRLRELRLRSDALERETRVRVLVPDGTKGDGIEPGLPVLLLLHGGGAESDHTNWTDRGRAEAITEGKRLLVVMPDGGKGGWYSDWLRPHTRHRFTDLVEPGLVTHARLNIYPDGGNARMRLFGMPESG